MTTSCSRLPLALYLAAALAACGAEDERKLYSGSESSDLSDECPDGDCPFPCADGQTLFEGDCYDDVCADLGKSCGYLIDDLGEPQRCGACLADAECGPYNECLVENDRLEPNDGLDGAYSWGEVAEGFDARADGLMLTTGDEDWFMYYVTDGAGFLGVNLGNPQTNIKVGGSSERWDGDVYYNVNLETEIELTAWWQCDTAEQATEVKCGYGLQYQDFNEVESLPVEEDLGVGCRVQGKNILKAYIDPQCESTDDSGWIIFRIRRPNQEGTELPRPALGDGYSLSVSTG
jgi:hypothetical protein